MELFGKVIIILVLLYFVVKYLIVLASDKMEVQAGVNLDNQMDNLIKKVLDSYDIEIQDSISKYLPHLALKKKQLIYIDDYGDKDERDWEKELERFIDKKLYVKNKVLIELDDLFTADTYALTQFQKRFAGTPIDYFDSIVKIELKYRIEIALLDFEDTQDNYFDVDDSDPISYENSIAEVFEQHGWEARVTKASGDQGADVIAKYDGFKMIIQCKLYSSPVSNKAVQEVYSALNYYNGDKAVVITNSTFTKSAKQLAESNDVLLIHHSQLDDLLTI